MAETCLYRTFDGEGRLLYVGISGNLKGRMAMHKSKSAWYPEMVRASVETYPSRREAENAERKAILSEGPTHNVAKLSPLARRWRDAMTPDEKSQLDELKRQSEDAKANLRATKSRLKARCDARKRRAKKWDAGEINDLADDGEV